MCGFVGIFRRDDQPAIAGDVDCMLKPLQHRGPDDRGVWFGDGVALGHVRLTILDLTDNARQPMLVADGSGVLVFNGEVYNYLELRAELERDGAKFKSTGDTEVVARAIQYWGVEQAVPRFNGMFAFAYFNTIERTLWLVRDRLGIKPLYVAECGSEFLFGSEPKALLEHPRMSKRPDRLAIASFIQRGRPDPRISLFEGISSIEPGTWWRVQKRSITRKTWFHVLDALEVDRLLDTTHIDAPTRFKQAVDESVRLHLASDVPLATICSGGVDSSLITALAHRQIGDLRSYVADVQSDRGEGAIAQRVADSLGIPITRVPVNREDYLRNWPEAISYGGAPCFHRSDVALLILVRECHADGIKVLLNGEGADELFGGYTWQEAAYRTFHWRDRVARGLIPVPQWRKKRRRQLRNQRFQAIPGLARLSNRLAATVDGEGEARRRALAEKLKPVRSRADRAFLARCLDDLYYSLDTLLRRHDRMAMASSVEMRVPFVENGLIDLGMHLPLKAKFNRGQSKWTLKQVARQYLPEDIVFAPKRAFPLPFSYDAGCESLLNGGAAGELLHWAAATHRSMIEAASRDHNLRLHLVGMEIWARLTFVGDEPGSLADELLGAARG